jgi:PGF-CTERM protein
MDSTANNYNADAEVDDGTCTFDTTEPEDVPGCMDSAADNYNADATSDDGSCEYTVDEDEVPGFGLLAAVAAIGVALILRRRL